MEIIRTGNTKTFYSRQQEGVEYLYAPLLEQTNMVRHLFSTRLGGVSTNHLYSMNLSYTRNDCKEAVDENFRRIAKVLHCNSSDFVCSDQTHTTNIRVVTAEDRGKGVTCEKDYTDIDGLITNDSRVVLATFYADCVPLFFVDVENRAIGLSHSGWRGTVNRMGLKTLEAMNREFGTNPEHVVAAVGPSICRECYEISEDVANEFKNAFREEEISQILEFKGLDKENNRKYQLDLWKANELILLNGGIRKENLAITDICTCHNPQHLFSHRATGGKRGNLGAFLGILRES